MQTDTTHNGWRNWDTWNAVLWMDNEEHVYMERWRNKVATIPDAKALFRKHYPQGTPDGAKIGRVYWPEVVAAWREEYAE